MRIRVEPKEFFMNSVFLAFSQAHADPEDEDVKAYLAEHELIPKWQGIDRWDGQEFEVMYFGGCYLGKHLGAIGDMQRKSVEQEMLTSEIERILGEETGDSATRRAAHDIPEPQLKEIMASLAQKLHQESSFGTDEKGNLKITLDPDLAQRKFMEIVGDRA